MDIDLVLDGYKSSFEVLGESQLIVDISLAWWLSASYAAWWGAGPFPVVFCLVADPLNFSSAVFLLPPVLFSILVFVFQSTFWFFQNPG